MKTMGLLGGMSWESTIPYYQTVNRVVRDRLGGLHSAKVLLYSVDFHEVESCQSSGRWADAGEMLITGARSLERGGAEFLVLCTNTMHKVAEQIEDAVGIPLLHIADATAARVKAAGIRRVGLLGTRFTMEEDFYRGRLESRHGLEVVVPAGEARNTVHRIIYDELCRGSVLEESRAAYREIVGDLRAQHAEGVILGCTEIGLLLRPEDVEVPLFDTAVIHAEQAARYALES
jgi:aspartate racemase